MVNDGLSTTTKSASWQGFFPRKKAKNCVSQEGANERIQPEYVKIHLKLIVASFSV